MQTTLIRLDHLPAHDRFDFWWETVAASVVSVDAASDHATDFWAEMTAVDLGRVRLSRVRCAPFLARRTARRIRQSDPGLYQLNLTFDGRAGLDQEGRQVLLRPQDFVLYDTSRPFHAWSAAGTGGLADGIVVQVPHAALRLPAKTIDRLLSVRIPTGTGVSALLAALLEKLIGRRDRYLPPVATCLSSAITELITGMLTEHAGIDAHPEPDSRGATAILGVQAFIERHLGDDDLTPATVAAAHHMSLRHLQRLFERQGLSVAQWIRERRLDRARRDLTDPLLDALTVGTIGARWGFRNDAHFNRAFCMLFGVSPGAYRRRRQPRSG
ncbi:helix-turn-helix domain-containing protein [Herbidospora cretacea]|uniref:AraC-like ligand-binding domain-containing protein n=1 Tax=Herbidospora cretacea TaxID=28444 RepID=UPI0007730F32|nr:helix-turn-helix domain-containing protein [Herbidospora cretacea]